MLTPILARLADGYTGTDCALVIDFAVANTSPRQQWRLTPTTLFRPRAFVQGLGQARRWATAGRRPIEDRFGGPPGLKDLVGLPELRRMQAEARRRAWCASMPSEAGEPAAGARPPDPAPRTAPQAPAGDLYRALQDALDVWRSVTKVTPGPGPDLQWFVATYGLETLRAWLLWHRDVHYRHRADAANAMTQPAWLCARDHVQEHWTTFAAWRDRRQAARGALDALTAAERTALDAAIARLAPQERETLAQAGCRRGLEHYGSVEDAMRACYLETYGRPTGPSPADPRAVA
jgi:hypothetical protein